MLQALQLTMTTVPVKVVIRIRPPKEATRVESAALRHGSSNSHRSSFPGHGYGHASTISSKEDGAITLTDLQVTGHRIDDFHFDDVFGADANTVEVYNSVARPLIESAMKGYNATIFTYGQSHTGKTFTMFGSESSPGVVMLAIDDIFHHIAVNESDRFFIVRIALLEIHKEHLIDLADGCNNNNPATKRLRSGFIFIENLIEEICADAHSARRIVSQNLARRHNSHVICRMIIESKQIEGTAEARNLTRVSELNFVVLAGSEGAVRKVSLQTKMSTETEREESAINRSLLMLGLVIQQLSQGAQTVANFRNSLLTRLLQNALAGNSYTAIICTVSDRPVDIKQTLSTLKFASMAKLIKTKPQLNGMFPIEHAVLPRLQIRTAELRRSRQLGSDSSSISNSSSASNIIDSARIRECLLKEIFVDEEDLADAEDDDSLSMVSSLDPVTSPGVSKEKPPAAAPLLSKISSTSRRMSWSTTDQGHAVLKLLALNEKRGSISEATSALPGTPMNSPLTLVDRAKTEIIFDNLLVARKNSNKTEPVEEESDENESEELASGAEKKLHFIVGDSADSIPGLYYFEEPEQWRERYYVPKRAFDCIVERTRQMKRALVTRFPPGTTDDLRDDDEFEVILEKLCLALSAKR